MNPEYALYDLLTALEAERGHLVVAYSDTAEWEDGAVAWCCDSGLLTPMPSASHIECRGCEHRCFSEVFKASLPAGGTRNFVVCEEPDMQATMGQVPVMAEQLRRWRCDMPLLARVVAGLLELHLPTKNKPIESNGKLWPLGMLRGKQGRHWVSLQLSPLCIEVNQQVMPLAELLFVEGERLVVDRSRVDAAVNAKNANATAKRYQPDTSKRELSKLATQARYQSWRDAYAAMSAKQRANGKLSCAKVIAKLPIAEGKDYETIRGQL